MRRGLLASSRHHAIGRATNPAHATLKSGSGSRRGLFSILTKSLTAEVVSSISRSSSGSMGITGFHLSRPTSLEPTRRGFAAVPEFTTIMMPSLSPTMTHGTISEWTKKPGDICGAGDVLCEIETDKAVVSYDVQDEFVLAKILEDAKGREIKVGEPVAISVEDQAAYQAFVEADKAGEIEMPMLPFTPAPGTAPAPSAVASSSPSPPPPPSSPSPTAHLGDFALSPAARHLIHSQHLTLSTDVRGTGKGGRLTKGDVIRAISNGQVTATPPSPPAPSAFSAKAAPAVAATAPVASAAPAATIAPAALPPVHISEIHAMPGTFADSKNSNMRKIIARRLAESKATVPHVYETVDCEIDAVLTFRKRLQKEYEVSVSVNDVIIRSAALALRDVPEANAFWDGKQGTAVLNKGVDISVAVATPTGLITPIITMSDRRRLTEISATMKDLAGRARQGKLKPEEFQGGSFTISNLGMFGIDEFSAVINPPQAAIMAVGRGAKRVRAPEFVMGQDVGSLKPYSATVMTATLSFDRRVLDEALAAQFLQAFKSYMSRPELLLL